MSWTVNGKLSSKSWPHVPNVNPQNKPRETPVVASVIIFADLQDMYRSWNFDWMDYERSKEHVSTDNATPRMNPLRHECIPPT